MEPRTNLTARELAGLDLMITVAQARGLGIDDIATDDNEMAEAQADHVEAMWEARHGGIEFSDRDREVLQEIRRLASTLETRLTLGKLVALRGEAVRNQPR